MFSEHMLNSWVSWENEISCRQRICAIFLQVFFLFRRKSFYLIQQAASMYGTDDLYVSFNSAFVMLYSSRTKIAIDHQHSFITFI